MTIHEMSGTQKAATLMSLIDEESAAKVLRHLEEGEMRVVIEHLARLETVDPDDFEGMLEEFENLLQDARGIERVGAEKALRLLRRADVDAAHRLVYELGEDEHEESLDAARMPGLHASLLEASSSRLVLLLRAEPPQTVALVLSALPERKAARVLGGFSAEKRAEIVRRLATIRGVQPSVLGGVSEILSRRLAELEEDPLVPVDGLESAVRALRGLGRASGAELVDALEEEQPELAHELRERLYTFEILRGLTDRDAPELLKQIDRATLALALKGADLEIRQIFFRNMSERAGKMLEEEMEFFSAPRVVEIENAQRSVVDAALRLEKEGVIFLEDVAHALV